MRPYLLIALFPIMLSACGKEETSTQEPTKPAVTEVLAQADSLIIIHGMEDPQFVIYRHYLLKPNATFKETHSTNLIDQDIDYDKNMGTTVHDSVKHLLGQVSDIFFKKESKNYFYSPNRPAHGATNLVRVYKDGQKYSWVFDADTSGLPDSVKPFAIRVQTVAEILNRN